MRALIYLWLLTFLINFTPEAFAQEDLQGSYSQQHYVAPEYSNFAYPIHPNQPSFGGVLNQDYRLFSMSNFLNTLSMNTAQVNAQIEENTRALQKAANPVIPPIISVESAIPKTQASVLGAEYLLRIKQAQEIQQNPQILFRAQRIDSEQLEKDKILVVEERSR